MQEIASVSGSIAFLGNTYDDALGLLVEARNYLARLPPGRPEEPPHLRLQISYETMRLTARLTQIMAWLLAQKAVHGGELTREEAQGGVCSLDAKAVCLDPSSSANQELPPGLRSLLDRSYGLYLRVYRLDAMTRGERV